jgi:hypothetical protein
MKRMVLMFALCVSLGLTGYAQDFGGFGDFGGGFGSFGDASVDEAMIRSDMAMMQMDGLVPMRFANALDGKPIPGATVAIPGIGTFTTNAKGIITFPQRADGTFTMTVSKSGFITTPIEFKIQTGIVIFNWFSISPEMPNKDYRIVLDWGERPSDLDLHFEKRGGYHISYRNMRSHSDGNVQLDRDDTSGYGPETITIERTDARSVYTLYVIDYTNQRSRNSSALSQSGAVIRVYSRNQLLHTFQVPAGQGTRWEVFRIEGGNITPISTLAKAEKPRSSSSQILVSLQNNQVD